MSIKFLYNGETYPQITAQEFDYNEADKLLQYERFITIAPNPNGDYDMIEIDSAGKYELLEEISAQYVSVIA